jgi:hypothetical protein
MLRKIPPDPGWTPPASVGAPAMRRLLDSTTVAARPPAETDADGVADGGGLDADDVEAGCGDHRETEQPRGL